ncbi:MAG: hypothetical protein FWE91_04710 [Defluviitaleaceae bacterium]|nr:hypothetical protein [Defluviitaleaceae bacterium]MCL2837000.1 hypothetical protein [Defluviitaleaceae bacterium]
MRKIITVLLIALLSLNAVSCVFRGKNAPDDAAPDATADIAGETAAPETIYTMQDFFPRTHNRQMHFEGLAASQRRDTQGNVFPNEIELYTVFFNDHVRGSRSQTRIMSWRSGAEYSLIEVYEISQGNLWLINTRERFFDHTDYTAEIPSLGVLILSEPFEAGNEWIRFQLGEAVHEVARIISMNTEITVPYGTFDAMVVEVTDEVNGVKTLEYYAAGLGLIKTERQTEIGGQYQQLVDVVDGPLPMFMQFFYGWNVVEEFFEDYDEPFLDNVPDMHHVPVEYHTNTDLIPFYMNTFRAYLRDYWNYNLSSGVDINSISYDRAANLLHVDFTPAFITEMSGLGELESHVMQLAADTLGFLYRAHEVAFTVNGDAYGQVLQTTMYKEINGLQ